MTARRRLDRFSVSRISGLSADSLQRDCQRGKKRTRGHLCEGNKINGRELLSGPGYRVEQVGRGPVVQLCRLFWPQLDEETGNLYSICLDTGGGASWCKYRVKTGPGSTLKLGHYSKN